MSVTVPSYQPPTTSDTAASAPAAPSTPRWAIPLLAAVFVLSGGAGLIYESIWTRYLGLFVGHSAYAQIIVLVIFLGGMSIGAFAAGQRSASVRHPLLWYAAVEFVVGVIGFFFHDLYVAVTRVAYDNWFPALAGGWGLTVVKWTLASVLILPQSILLGTTFPLMSAGVMRLRTAREGHVLGLLYFANSLGAAIGVLVAGFVLLAWTGLPGTLLTAAMLNFAAALAVALPVRGGYLSDSTPLAEPPKDSPERTPGVLWRLLMLVSFATALSSFVYEIGWIRMLSLVLGSATHSFELMLSAFILGLALGALWVRRRADGFRDPVRTLGIVQWAMGILAIATLPLYIQSFDWMAALLQTFRANDAGYASFVLARYAICLLVMLPATFCAGMTLPLITRTLIRTGTGERSIGQVYGINTLGSIVGAALAGLLLMPLLGLKWLLITGALVDVAIGALLLAHARSRAPAPAAALVPFTGSSATPRALAAATLVFIVGVAVFVRFDHAVLTSGVYRHSLIPKRGVYEFLFYRDGRTATVSVRRTKGDTASLLTLSTNGKPDATVDSLWSRPPRANAPRGQLRQDLGTQVLLPIMTLAHMPRARQAAVIGQGSGMSSHILLGSPHLERLYTIEIEPEMINGSRLLGASNRRVFEDPRSTFVIDDAKSFFAASGRRFDLILSEPSNPWVSGVSGLFTVEFYERMKRQLTDDGIFGQWLHLYEISDAMVVSVLAAIDRTFPSYEMYLTSNLDMLVVASNRELRPADWSVVELPGIREDLQRVVPLTPESFEALRLANRTVLHPYLSMQQGINSDFYPLLDLGTERTRYQHTMATGIAGLAQGRFDVVAALAQRRQPFARPYIAPAPEVPRAKEQSIASRLRAMRDGGIVQVDTIADEDLRLEFFRTRRLLNFYDAGVAPGDWRLWVRDFTATEQALHAGTAGTADERFYAATRAYLDRANAPVEARAAVDFFHGLASWDWDEVDRAGEVLVVALERRREYWLPLELLREGLATSRLRRGDFAGASRAFKRLAPFSPAPPTFRDRVLAAVVLQGERGRLATR